MGMSNVLLSLRYFLEMMREFRIWLEEMGEFGMSWVDSP